MISKISVSPDDKLTFSCTKCNTTHVSVLNCVKCNPTEGSCSRNEKNVLKNSELSIILANINRLTIREIAELISKNPAEYESDYVKTILGFYIPKYGICDLFVKRHASSLILGMMLNVPKILLEDRFTNVSNDKAVEWFGKYETPDFNRDSFMRDMATTVAKDYHSYVINIIKLEYSYKELAAMKSPLVPDNVDDAVAMLKVMKMTAIGK
jgi:hypothetical protein